MRKSIRFAAATALLAAAVGVVPTQAQDDDVVIGYVAPGLVGAQAQIQQGLVDGAAEKGWEVLTVTSGGDAQKQLNDINDMIAQQVDAIVAVPDDSAGACVGVAAAQEAGIPFYTIDRSVSGCQTNLTVLSDNYLAGQQSGEDIVKFLTERYGEPKGKVLEITGNLAQNVAQLRGGGFQEVMDANPNITVIEQVGDWDSAKGADIVRDIASAEADLDAIYMHSDCAYGPSVVQTLAELGKTATRGEEGHIHLSGVDGCLVALDFIRDGIWDQSSNQPIPDFGKVLVGYIETELGGGTIEAGEVLEEGALWSPARIEDSDVGKQLLLATTSVTEENVDDERLWGNIEAAAAE